MPRKGVLELQRVLTDEGVAELAIGTNHVRAQIGDVRFTSKLIDGRFPEYSRVIPAAPANARVIIARYRMGHSPLLPAPAAKQAIGQNGPQDRQPFSQDFNAVQGRLHNR